MIDLQSNDFTYLKQIDPGLVYGDIQPLLINGETVISTYKSSRVFCIFTDKRIIAESMPGMTKKKKDYTSLPYSKVIAFSVQTAGTLDLDSELEMYFSEIGKIKFSFSGRCDIVQIGQIIGTFVL